MPVSSAFSTYPSGSPAREPSLQAPFKKALTPPPEPLSIIKVPSIWAHSRLPNWASIKRDANPQSLPFITFRAPTKGPPPLSSPNRAPFREMPRFQSPLRTISQEFLLNWTPPPWANVHLLCPPPHIFRDPQKGAPLKELSQREMLPFWSPPSIS